MPRARDTDFVLRTAEERDVRFVRLWFVDVLGLLKSFAVPLSELAPALEDGVELDGSALEGNARGAERDVIAYPDARSFQVLPWRGEGRVARMFCDVRTPDGEPFAGDSRQALRRVLDQAAELGWTLQVGCEVEFFLFRPPAGDGDRPQPLDEGAYFDLTPQDLASDFRRRVIEYLEQMGIPVTASHHEVAPSQQEIHLKHTDPLTMADALTTFRLTVKAVAEQLGVYATFMPQPLEGVSGSGMHLHLSLWEGERNLFFDPGGEQPLGPRGREFLAGLLAHAPEMTASTNQWVNSYKRLAGGMEAPESASWTRHGRSGLVRVPTGRPGREAAARLELRSPDPAANPYLVLALVVAAGLEGIERSYGLPPESDNGGPPAEPRPLPRDLREATELFDRSELARATLGDRLCDWYVANKRAECDAYDRTVTEFERRRYLRLL